MKKLIFTLLFSLLGLSLMFGTTFQPAKKESEIFTIKEMFYGACESKLPIQNTQTYSGKVANAFLKATKFDPGNPRPIYLQAISLLYTPEEYEGGKQAACPLFKKAIGMFVSYKPVSDIATDWGEEQCQNYFYLCNEVAEK
jgi:hypothetical protein